jgi:hypothetical protein
MIVKQAGTSQQLADILLYMYDQPTAGSPVTAAKDNKSAGLNCSTVQKCTTNSIPLPLSPSHMTRAQHSHAYSAGKHHVLYTKHLSASSETA